MLSQVCLLSTFSLLLTCIDCVEIEDSSVIPSARCKIDPGLVPHPKTSGFPSKIRLPGNTNTIPIRPVAR